MRLSCPAQPCQYPPFPPHRTCSAPSDPTGGRLVAKPNYSFEKRQRELAKKKKKEEKNQRKLAKSDASGAVPAESPSDAKAPADAGDTVVNT